MNLTATTSGAVNETAQLNNYELHTRQQHHFMKLQRSIKNGIRLQSDPGGQIINLTQKKLSGETFKLLNKNLDFVQNQTNINKKELHNQLDEFYRCIKPKAHFEDMHKQANLFDEEYRFKSKSNKNWVPTKTYHIE